MAKSAWNNYFATIWIILNKVYNFFFWNLNLTYSVNLNVP